MRLACLVLSVLFVSCGQSMSSDTLNDQDEGRHIGIGNFPGTPMEKLTVGSLCEKPDSFRYREHIAYCERSVSRDLKASIIAQYDKEFGFRIHEMNRQDFKIDHYIPLCMGGSNQRDNLWPQHKSLFVHTDPIEEKLCILMQQGNLEQKVAVEKIIYIKNHISEADDLNESLNRKLSK